MVTLYLHHGGIESAPFHVGVGLLSSQQQYVDLIINFIDHDLCPPYEFVTHDLTDDEVSQLHNSVY